MKRFRHRRKTTSRRRKRMLSGLFLLPICLCAAWLLPVDLGRFTERAALFSVMVSMPQGSAALLESRFSAELDKDYYKGQTQQVVPYLAPWPVENNPDLPEASAPFTEPAPAPALPPAKKQAISQDASPAKQTSIEIPEKYKGRLVQENMAGGTENLLSYGQGKLRNYTEVADDEVVRIMEQGMNIHLEKTDQPQVLIFHTHATESYEPYDSDTYDTRNTWRSTDAAKNMIAVGNALEKALEDAGIKVIHDTTKHDYPSYNGSYERSAKTIQGWLEKYPTIKVALDIHRDAIQREEDLIVKPVIEINGRKAAQLMIITGSEDGTMNVPKWRENLRFAASLQNAIEQDYPQLTRPIFFCYRKYNMDKTTGSLLLEVGANANTLEESVYTAELVGKSLAKLLTEHQVSSGKAAASSAQDADMTQNQIPITKE